jgi:hypothetical protein
MLLAQVVGVWVGRASVTIGMGPRLLVLGAGRRERKAEAEEPSWAGQLMLVGSGACAHRAIGCWS